MAHGRPQTVLAVDDNEATRYLVTRMLRRAGFVVLEASTGHEALERMGEAPDIVVLDVRLPDMSGLEVCRRLKTAPATRTIPVLHLSASYTESDDKAVGLDGGADGYLTHPVEPSELVATVRALLRARDAEEEAFAAARQWQATFDAIGDGVCLVDDDGVIVRANDALARLVERPRAMLRGAALMRVLDETGNALSPEDARAMRAAFADRLALVREVALADGRWYRLTTAPVEARPEDATGTARDSCTVCILEDITDRRERDDRQRFLASASAALATSLDHRATLATLARFAVPTLADLCVIDVETVEGDVSRVVVEGFADDPSESRRQARERLREAAPACAHRRNGALDRVRAAGAPVLVTGSQDDVLRVLAPMVERPDAMRALRPREALLVPLAARGRALGVAIFVATRPGRYADASVHATLVDLAGRAALAADNARLYEQALAANQAKADFLAIMSHELRTPLNAILGYADLLEFGIGGALSSLQGSHVSRIKLSGRHLLGLIDEVLTYSRIEAGKEAALLEHVDIGRLVGEAAALVEPLFTAKRLRLDVSVPATAEPIIAWTDARKLRQVLVNLLSNAVKFTDDGRVGLALRREGPRLVIDVRDSGIGIAPEHLEHIFDPFWQVEQTVLTRRSGGTGLGLSVVRRLARMRGGDVGVTSCPGAGSCFPVWLPCDEGAQRPASAGIAPAAARASG